MLWKSLNQVPNHLRRKVNLILLGVGDMKNFMRLSFGERVLAGLGKPNILVLR